MPKELLKSTLPQAVSLEISFLMFYFRELGFRELVTVRQISKTNFLRKQSMVEYLFVKSLVLVKNFS